MKYPGGSSRSVVFAKSAKTVSLEVVMKRIDTMTDTGDLAYATWTFDPSEHKYFRDTIVALMVGGVPYAAIYNGDDQDHTVSVQAVKGQVSWAAGFIKDVMLRHGGTQLKSSQ
jgi:hypothetical protein